MRSDAGLATVALASLLLAGLAQPTSVFADDRPSRQSRPGVLAEPGGRLTARAPRPVALPPLDERVARLERWRDAVESTLDARDRTDRPAIAALTADDIAGVVFDLGVISRWVNDTRSNPVAWSRPGDGARMAAALEVSTPEAFNALVRHGVLAHTIAAIDAGDGRGNTAPRREPFHEPRRLVVVRDGQPLAVVPAGIHWEGGRELLATLLPSPASEPAVREWYVTVAAYMQYHTFLGELEPHLGSALRLFPEDGRLLFEAAAMHEAFASPAIQAALSAQPRPGWVTPPPSASSRLRDAERLYRRAIDTGATLPDAPLRLGWIATRQGRHDEALSLLTSATLDDDDSRYLQALFLGRVHEASGRYDDARLAYERAAALCPTAQSPWLALAHLASSVGTRADAREAVEGLQRLGADVAARPDPWWFYPSSHIHDLRGLLLAVARTLTATPGPSP